MTDPISLQAMRRGFGALLISGFAAWIRMDPGEFVEEKLRIAAEHGSTRAWSWDFFPPQREMFMELFNPRNREVVYKIASRLTKTWTVLAAIGYWISESPRKIGVMWPKNNDGENWSKKHFSGELLDPNPFLSEIVPDGTGRRRRNNTILEKFFPGGYLSIFGANVPGDLRRFKGNVLYSEEIDAIADTGEDSVDRSDEGDILKQFHIRGTEFTDTIEIFCSFPGLKGRSRIDKKHAAGDCRVWRVPCLSCGYDEWVMHRKDLRYDKDKPELTRIECPHCHDLHNDAARYKMSRIPKKWTPTAAFRGVTSFHANCMLWPHPVDPIKYAGGFLHMLATEEIDAENADNPEKERRVIVNTRDAESYQPEHLQKIEHTALYKRREKYDPRDVLPAEVVFITFGADLQSNRAEIKFKGWGQRDVASGSPQSGDKETRRVKQSWAIDYRIVRGSPLQTEFWEKVENVLRNVAWKHPSGAWIRPSIGLIDSSYRPDDVYAFGRRMQKLRIYACEGAEQLGKAIVQKKPIKRGVPPALVWEIGTHEAKDIIYQQLEISDPAAQGYNHYPEMACFTETHFHQLTIEDSVMQRARDGQHYRWFFKKSSDDRNEPLDCEVYANAAEQIFRPNYEKLMAEYATEATPAPPPNPNANPDMNLPTARPRMNRSGSKWMAGFRKV